MKKNLLFATAIAATSVFAFDSNEIALKEVTPPKADGRMLLAIPFNGYGTGDSAAIAIADVLLTDALSAGDKIYLPRNEAGKYDEYTLSNDKTTWTASRVVDVTSGSIQGTTGTPADQATIQRGKAFWLQSSATDVKLLGQAASQSKASVAASEGYQLLAPTTSENDILISSLAGATGDVVILADGTRYQKTGKSDAGNGWRNVAARNTVIGDSDKIPAGVGFWYKAGGSRTLSL